MASYKTFKGSELNLETYQGKSSIDYEIEVLNDDGTEFDLSIYIDLVCTVFYRQHGEVIISPTVTNTENFILLDALMAQTSGLQTREYFYELHGVLASDEEELITYGVFKNV